MKKQYKIQLPKGKKVTMTNVDFENGVMTVNVELEKDGSNIWDRMIQEYGEAICGNTEQKYEPKDGDFIYLKRKVVRLFPPSASEVQEEEREAIAIFKGIKKCGDINGLFCYVTYLSNDGLSGKPLFIYDNMNGYECSLGDVSMYDEIRPATEIEKTILINQLAKVNKKWNKETKRIEDVRWRAKEDELFYVVAFNARVDSIKDSHNWFTDLCYETGNYFKTREAAEKAAEQIREIFKTSKSE